MPRFASSALVLAGLVIPAFAGDWPQFRGPAAARQPGVDRPLPAEIGPDRNVLWKTPLPPGHSSPIVVGDRIYLTAERDKKLLTIGLDRAGGKQLWEAEAPYRQLEKIHAIGSHVQATPVSDGDRVVSFFGSCGLFCYDRDGKPLWHLPLGPFKNDLGAGSSPIIAGDFVLLNEDHDIDSFLIAVHKKSGKVAWKVARPEAWVGYATPVLWDVNGKKQVVVAGSLRVTGYDLETGKPIWFVNGLARAVHVSPLIGPDNTLYVGGWTGGGDSGDRFDVPSFTDLLAKHDKNKNGTIEKDEMPAGPLLERFSMIDRDKDGHVTREEYEFARGIFTGAMNRIMAIKPGGTGDVSETHVLWSQRKYLSVVASPLLFKDRIFMARDNGVAAVLDAKTGTLERQERLFGSGPYYSSPVAGDGKIYFVSQRGDLTVVGVEPEWRIVHREHFGDEVYATPAIVDGKIYFRTTRWLYCFGNTEPGK